jgi:hypothetical protein
MLPVMAAQAAAAAAAEDGGNGMDGVFVGLGDPMGNANMLDFE